MCRGFFGVKSYIFFAVYSVLFGAALITFGSILIADEKKLIGNTDFGSAHIA